MKSCRYVYSYETKVATQRFEIGKSSSWKNEGSHVFEDLSLSV